MSSNLYSYLGLPNPHVSIRSNSKKRYDWIDERAAEQKKEYDMKVIEVKKRIQSKIEKLSKELKYWEEKEDMMTEENKEQYISAGGGWFSFAPAEWRNKEIDIERNISTFEKLIEYLTAIQEKTPWNNPEIFDAVITILDTIAPLYT